MNKKQIKSENEENKHSLCYIEIWIGFVQFDVAVKGDKYHKNQRKGKEFVWENSNKSMQQWQL